MAKKKFTIDRERWGDGYLYCDGEYCALGFMLKELGVPDEVLDMRSTAGEVYAHHPEHRDLLMDWGLTDRKGYSTLFSGDITGINDDGLADREEKLAQLFEKHGFRLVGTHAKEEA